ncbi:type I polyketide synthase [Yersinia kristensenii]|uniref:type I polyketide synthase n=1 Tax=Yersinia kristensenii TaxID=28152 RepID=UPI0001A54A31|nr:type I polyketide synthase [Yersinia kristensenii]EEP93157.1 Oxidoreductase, short chain dehydrogenase/reductase family [Yersinia kristensenii ATCC 33638]EEP93409.1 Oxidoreductase, short chain dehydrogenase/reductase family [Yersinia kristensenii ATCC 33638]PEH55691.1 type I polyketide synthase [Yersinia kristensenii]SUP69631.1 yersiniabactin synthetase, HMWP1 component [Yersinia kristensenii]
MPIFKEPIAIVGIGCRMPGKVLGPDDLWMLLLGNISGIIDIPPDRWSIREYYDPNPNKTGKMKVARGGFIEGVDLFDNEFFNIYPKEAENIDPQQRLLLHSTHEALEDSGDTLDKFQGSKTAVYIGSFANDYQDILADSNNRYLITPHAPMGTSLTSLSNRISYLYNLKGPSVTLDTACSTSLVAVHHACQCIWHQECDSAISGGVSLNINPAMAIMLSKGNFLSPDGECRSFDESANGYVRGEGVAVVYLKTLSKAITDDNKIYGLIRGSACNSDGFTAQGFTVPSSEAQTDMLHTAYRDANINVDQVQFIEAHGTGTAIGDPLEARAFANVFKPRIDHLPLLIGSIKSNIGHLEGASGIAGLIKLALCLYHKYIPANLHFKKGNPNIDFDNWGIKVVDNNQVWPEQVDGSPRVGGVNSFGAGGTNAHVVLEEYIESPSGISKNHLISYRDNISSLLRVFTCSAHTEVALKQLLNSYQDYLSKTQSTLNDICFNSGKHRSDLRHRIAIVACDSQDLINKIEGFLQGNTASGVEYSKFREKKPRIAFIFTGQGPQWYAMGRQLAAAEPIFALFIQKIDRLFLTLAGWSLLDEMNRPQAESNINDTWVVQPALMAIQIALTELWKSYGIEPEGVIGHSLGEVAAAYAAGALTLEQAVEIIYQRSRILNLAIGKGSMLAVGLTLQSAELLIADVADKVSIAAVNGPESITLSGDQSALDSLIRSLESHDVFYRFLKVEVPYHSHHMVPLQQEFIDSFSHIRSVKAHIPLYSTVSSQQEDGTHLEKDYWYKNARQTVYFSQTLEKMLNEGFDIFIEIGPHPALSNSVEEVFVQRGIEAQVYPSLRRQEDESLRFWQTMGALYVAGVPMSWDKICPAAQRLYDLPRYPWQQSRFWNENRIHRDQRLQHRFHPHFTHHHHSAISPAIHIYTIFLDQYADPYLGDHRMDDIAIFPATGHLELATAAARKAFGSKFNCLEDMHFKAGLFLSGEAEAIKASLEVYSDEGRYCIMSCNNDAQWVINSSGRMNCLDEKKPPIAVSLSELQTEINDRLPIQPMYNGLKRGGLSYGHTFKTVESVWVSPGKILAKIILHPSLEYECEDFLLHPSILDTCGHIIYAARLEDPDIEIGVYLPVYTERYTFYESPNSRVVWSYLTIIENTPDFLQGNIIILNDDGSTVAEFWGLRLKYIVGSRQNEENIGYKNCYEHQWVLATDFNVKPASGIDILLIGDDSFEHSELINTLSEANINLVTLGEFEECGWSVDLQDRQAVTQTVQKIKSRYPAIGRVVITLPFGRTEVECLYERTEELMWKILNVHYAIMENKLQTIIWYLTNSSERVVAEDKKINLIESVIFGLARVMSNEYPMAVCKTIDVSCLNSKELQQVANLISSVTSGGNEREFAMRDDLLFIRRLEKIDSYTLTKELVASSGHYQAFLAIPRNFSSAQFYQVMAPNLEDNEVEIAIKAASLNCGNGIYEQLGQQCSGIITQVGSIVSQFKCGDEVLAVAGNTIAGSVILGEDYVVHKPAQFSFDQAATLPIDYLTAYHCLCSLAGLRSDERLLIHHATNGLGIAAIHLAQKLNVVIFATADTETERIFLSGLGIKFVYDSQSLNFYCQIMDDTDGKGVNVVLNDLTGRGIVQGIRCLNSLGRFIDIAESNVGDMVVFQELWNRNVSYFRVDISYLRGETPGVEKQLLNNVLNLSEGLTLLPPQPFMAFPINELPAALAYQEQGTPIGKVIINMENQTINALPATDLVLNMHKVYLISGGTTGFGIELARWMVDKGARKLVLASRGGPKTDYDRAIIHSLQQRQVQILLLRVDITCVTSVAEMVTQAKALGPLGGIIHSAAVLHNNTIQNIERENISRAYSAKAMGAWNLHQALPDKHIDFFLIISSMTSIFGFPEQSIYSAANNFVDKLVDYRRMRGLPAQSVNFGILGEFAGMSRDVDLIINVLESQGLLTMTLKQTLASVERIILDGVSTRMTANIDWPRFFDYFRHLRSDKRISHLLSKNINGVRNTQLESESLRSKIQAMDISGGERELLEHLTQALAQILGCTVDKIESTKSLASIGMDSLMLNQLRHWIQQKLEINYPLMRIAKGPSLLVLASELKQMLSNNQETNAVDSDDSGITSDKEVEVVNKWFVCIRRKEGDVLKKNKLFMIPSMGAGATMFAHFLYNPPEDCEVYSVQLPGRENRLHDALYTHLTPLLNDLEKVLIDVLAEDKQQHNWQGGVVIYGHSYGGIIAFELCRLLRRKYGITPIHFFASATMPPQLTGKWKNQDTMRESSITSNSAQKILGLLSYIDDADFINKVLPGMRRDMPLLMSYDYQDDSPLSCPITVFSAIEDEVTQAEEMALWAEQTTSRFQQYLVHGDHWFVSRNKEFIGEKIAAELEIDDQQN